MQSAAMASQLKWWSKNKVSTVVQFLNARNMPETHCQLMEVYGEDKFIMCSKMLR
jgi:hypothetical protein